SFLGAVGRRICCILSCLLTAFLDVRFYEILRVFLEDFVDLVQQVVQFGLDLLALLRLRWGLFDDLLLARRCCSLLLFSLSHGRASLPPRNPAGPAGRPGSNMSPTTHRHALLCPVGAPSSGPGAVGRYPDRTPASP